MGIFVFFTTSAFGGFCGLSPAVEGVSFQSPDLYLELNLIVFASSASYHGVNNSTQRLKSLAQKTF
jgi:predicted membrane channel-forming protein YqfA (hemolysin III family)